MARRLMLFRMVTAQGACLTIAFHPDLSRVGEAVMLVPGASHGLSRMTPMFAVPDGAPRALADPYLSRAAVRVRLEGDHIELSSGDPLRLDGISCDRTAIRPRAALERGIVVALGGRALAILHSGRADTPQTAHELDGTSEALERVRRAIDHAARHEPVVMLVGETGAGKDRIARALHRARVGDAAPFVAINLAALVTATAPTALFGRDGDHQGLCAAAAGGTLYLDAIAEAPLPVQAMLTRLVETRTYRVGGTGDERTLDAQIIAAAEQPLTVAVARGALRSALLHRLASYELVVPPLRDRRVDLAILIATFLRAELASAGALDRLDATSHPWCPADLVERLVLAEWPGNVRELRNMLRRFVLDALHLPSIPSASWPVASAGGDLPDADTLLSALRANDWALGPTAQRLGVPRSTLYDRMARLGVRAARDVPDAELAAAHARLGGDVVAIASELQVSRRAIVLRLRAMGLEPSNR